MENESLKPLRPLPLLQALDRHGVDFVLVGGLAGVAHGSSYPTYDPSEFISGISQSRFAYLNDPATFQPILNRAIQGEYAPVNGVVVAGRKASDLVAYLLSLKQVTLEEVP